MSLAVQYVAATTGWLFSPLSIALWWMGAGLFLQWAGQKRFGTLCAAVGFGWLWLMSTPWAAERLGGRLEKLHPAVPVADSPSGDLVVVLGGAVAGARPPHSPTINLSGASDRVWHAAALHRAGKAPRVLLSGGSDPADGSASSEAEAMREMLTVLGVPSSAVMLETRSRSTRQNAEFSRALIVRSGVRRVLLVTSAMHMPRALRVFRMTLAGSGVELVPVATDVEALRLQSLSAADFLPQASALGLSTRAWKEHLGLIEVGLREMGWLGS